MSLFLQRLSVPSKFAAHLGGVATLTSASLAALAWSGVVRVDVARPELALACLAATGVLASAWTWWVSRTTTQPLKNALQLAEQAIASVGQVPAILGRQRGDEGQRLVAHLTQMQERQTQLVRTSVALKAAQEDQQDEMAAWAEDTLRLRSALDASGMHALITDEEGVILFVTRGLAQQLKSHQSAIKQTLPHVDLERLVGQKWEAFEPARQQADDATAEALSAAGALRFQDLAFQLTTHGVRNRQGQEVGQVVVWREASSAQDAPTPQPTGDKVAWAFDAMAIPAHVIDLHGHIVQSNHAFRTMLQAHAGAFKAANGDFDSDQLHGASAGMLYADPSAELSRLTTLSAKAQSRKVLGGRTYEVTEQPIHDLNGQIVGVLCQWQDCTPAWLAERAFAGLAQRVAAGDYAKPAMLDGLDGVYRQIGEHINRVVLAMNETSAPVREAVEQLGNALAQVAQSTLTVQEAIASMSAQQDGTALSRPHAMLAEKAGTLLAQMVPTINQTTEVLQEPMSKQASEVLAATADQLQEQAARLHAVVASYRLAVSSKATRPEEAQSALTACTA